jgi:hypothetical protein
MGILEFINHSYITIDCNYYSNWVGVNKLLALEDYSDEEDTSFFIACKDKNDNVWFFRLFTFVDTEEQKEKWLCGRPYDLILYQIDTVEKCKDIEFIIFDSVVEKAENRIKQINQEVQ